jgi:hypothetical protein
MKHGEGGSIPLEFNGEVADWYFKHFHDVSWDLDDMILA